MIKKILKVVLQHKFILFLVIIIAGAGSYFGYTKFKGDDSGTRYVLAAVAKGILITSISGAGQVSASNQVDIKPKVSGDVVYVGVKNGQEVKTGALLVSLDSREAQQAVSDAQTSLETAKLELEELLKPVDELTLLQAENSLIQLKESKQKSEDDLIKTYEDGFNSVVSAFFDLPTIMTEMEDIIYGNNINQNQDNIDAYADMIRVYEEEKATQYKNNVMASYQTARPAYDKNFQNYKNTNRYSDDDVIEALVEETYQAAKEIAELIKNTDNLISFVKDTLANKRGASTPAVIATHQATIKTDTSRTNSILSSLLSIKTTIKNDQEAILSADRSIKEKELSIAELKAGADELDIRAKKIAIQQKTNAILSAQQNLADHYISAPFDGVVTNIAAKKGESISTTALSLLTKQKMAEISLNEVDVAQVKTGQKATLTFDAVPDLTLTGEVAEIDSLGTVSQGVVTYNVKIVFDTQDERVKPAMSVSAAIITKTKTDVLLVSNSAIKQQGDIFYVEIMTETGTPQQQTVVTGLSNDTMTEIVSGLSEGDKVITQTITQDTSQNQSSASSGFRIPGLPAGGGFR